MTTDPLPSRSDSPREDFGHEWGPHKRGIRWVQCQRCECLLHDPEAKEPCPGDPAPIEARRERDKKAQAAKFAEIARRESGWRP